MRRTLITFTVASLRKFVVFTLIASMTLPLATPAFAQDPSLRSVVFKQFMDIETSLRVELRRARSPDSPGTKPGRTSAQDVQKLEGDVLEWRAQVEKLLHLREAPGGDGATEFMPAEEKNQLIGQYVNILSMLVSLRIAQFMSYGTEWSDQFALRVARTQLESLGLATETNKDRFGEEYSPIWIDHGPSQQADPVLIKPSASLVQGLALGRLAEKPGSASFLTLIQYMGTRQLFQNLTDVRTLQGKTETALPALPKSLIDKFEAVGLSQLVADEEARTYAEPAMRDSLIEEFTELQKLLPPFLTDSVLQEIATAITSDAARRKEILPSLKESLSLAEKEKLPSMAKDEIQNSTISFASLNSQVAHSVLSSILANLPTSALIDKFFELDAEGIMSLDLDRRKAIMKVLDAHRAKYAAAIPHAITFAWHEAALKNLNTRRRTRSIQRKEFTLGLYRDSFRVAEETRETSAGKVVDVAVLARSFSKKIAKLEPAAHVMSWLMEAAHAETYYQARDKWSQMMAILAKPAVLVDGVVDPALVHLYVEETDFKPALEFSDKVPSALSEKLIKSVTDGRKKDILDLLKVGQWMGFCKLFPVVKLVVAKEGETPPPSGPALRDILTEEVDVKAYFERLAEDLLTRNPVLSMEVSIPQGELPPASASMGDGGSGARAESELSPGKMRLSDLLVALNSEKIPTDDLPEGVITAADPFVDQALAQVEKNVLENIEKVANATDLRQLKVLIGTSMMMSLVMRATPEFHIEKREFMEELLSPEFMDQIVHKYVEAPILYGFGAMLLMQLPAWVSKGINRSVNWGAKKMLKRANPILGGAVYPILEALPSSFAPAFAGMMRGATILMIADTAYQANELKHAWADDKQRESLFYSSGSINPFLSYEEKEAAYWHLGSWRFHKKAMIFAGRLLLDTAFMYLPMVRTHFAEKVTAQFKVDVDAFQRLGAGPGRWDQVEPAKLIIDQVHLGKKVSTIESKMSFDQASALIGRAKQLSKEDYAKVEKAYAHLTSKMNSGKTWDFEKLLLESKPPTSADTRLQSALKRTGLLEKLKEEKLVRESIRVIPGMPPSHPANDNGVTQTPGVIYLRSPGGH